MTVGRQRPTRYQLEVLRAYIATGSIALTAHTLEITETTARQHVSELYRRTACLHVAQAAYRLGSVRGSSSLDRQLRTLRMALDRPHAKTYSCQPEPALEALGTARVTGSRRLGMGGSRWSSLTLAVASALAMAVATAPTALGAAQQCVPTRSPHDDYARHVFVSGSPSGTVGIAADVLEMNPYYTGHNGTGTNASVMILDRSPLE
jgi:hypothetical protein